MFEEFFGLSAKPFGKTPDPSFLYESKQHREALARLEYAVDEKELALLTGDIGSGKTTLSRALIDRVSESRPVVLLINPRLTPTQLLRGIAQGLGIEPGRFRNELVEQLHTKLYELHEENREPVLMIDEAQLIPTKATFDEIRLLTNFQLDDQNLLSVILIGQPELEERLDRAAYAPLRQRIGMRYSLGPLSPDETVAYIEHRIRVAGGARNPFTREAMMEIHSISGGIPRLINTLATTALLDAFGEDAELVEPERIGSAAREHRMEASAHG
ncbi:MAG TPA: AAA family ATPase [Thermoanaerobaculia bacterium]|jgi:type II secretory pathway predicted ATPase ExeA